MRVVLDTSTLVSALIAPSGKPAAIYNAPEVRPDWRHRSDESRIKARKDICSYFCDSGELASSLDEPQRLILFG